MNKTFFDLSFSSIKNINFFIIFIVIITIVIWRFYKIRSIANVLAPAESKNILLNFSHKKNVIKLFLLILGSFFLFFSLLGPAWGNKEETVQQEGRDVFIALDVSKSMLAKDVEPNRLEWSKLKIKKLLSLLKSERVGLILFSGSAVVQCPLTSDFSAFYMFLDQADTDVIASGTTSIDEAIKLTIARFDTNNSHKNKLLIIFTDGEDFSSDLANAREEAHKQGLKIFAIGVGTPEGSKIPTFDKYGYQTGYQLDENGKEIISALNEGILKALSQKCGGIYIKGTNNNEDIKEISHKVQQFEKEKFENRKISHLEQQYPYFIGISFICFALDWIL